MPNGRGVLYHCSLGRRQSVGQQCVVRIDVHSSFRSVEKGSSSTPDAGARWVQVGRQRGQASDDCSEGAAQRCSNVCFGPPEGNV
jgi:hypothetical protein